MSVLLFSSSPLVALRWVSNTTSLIPCAVTYSVTTGLGWVKAAEYVVVSGKPSKSDLESCWELGATVAAGLME